MRLLLCALLFCSAGWIGIQHAVECKRKPMLLFSLADSLAVMQCEICVQKKSLPAALKRCAKSFDRTKVFYQMLIAGLRLEQPFSEIWSRAVCQSLPLSAEERRAMLTLGEQIGQYDSKTQDSAFSVCIATLRNQAAQISVSSGTNARLSASAGIGIGLLLAIISY